MSWFERRRVRFLSWPSAMVLISVVCAQGQVAPANSPNEVQQTFYLNSTQISESTDTATAVRNLMKPEAKVYLVQSQNAIVVRSSPEQMAIAQKAIADLDRPKKSYRLTYTFTELDGGKRVGVQHFGLIVLAGQRTTLKQGSKVPLVTGVTNSPSNTQNAVTYIDVGMNFDASLDESASGLRLRNKVEQLSVAEEKSGVGSQDPVIRQTSLESTSTLTVGKPVILGSVDIPGSTRHVDVEVVAELVR